MKKGNYKVRALTKEKKKEKKRKEKNISFYLSKLIFKKMLNKPQVIYVNK